MQGTAAAYDLVQFGNAREIILADLDITRAEIAVDRVSKLTNASVLKAVSIDANDRTALHRLFQTADAVLCALPYWMPPQIAPIAIDAGTHYCDLGGDNEPGHGILALDGLAREAGVGVVVDSGLAPGLVNALATDLMEGLEQVESVKLFCGVLPRHPKPPLNYRIAFSLEGLIAEYEDQAVIRRAGVAQRIDGLSEVEELPFARVGKLEAFATSGGAGTAPYLLGSHVQNYEYKTLRFPGHAEAMTLFRDLGFWKREPEALELGPVVPRDLFSHLLTRTLSDSDPDDQTFATALVSGVSEGEAVCRRADVYDVTCPETGFSSMERLTGFSGAIYTAALANGTVPPGVHASENAMPTATYFSELAKRGVTPTRNDAYSPE